MRFNVLTGKAIAASEAEIQQLQFDPPRTTIIFKPLSNYY